MFKTKSQILSIYKLIQFFQICKLKCRTQLNFYEQYFQNIKNLYLTLRSRGFKTFRMHLPTYTLTFSFWSHMQVNKRMTHKRQELFINTVMHLKSLYLSLSLRVESNQPIIIIAFRVDIFNTQSKTGQILGSSGSRNIEKSVINAD